MPNAPLRIFISSTEKDLSEHRAKVATAIEAMGQATNRFELWPARTGKLVQECENDARSADVTIVIVAHHYGTRATPARGGDGRKSFTEYEVRAAVRAKRPVLAFIVDDSFDWQELRDKSPEDIEALNKFKGFLRDETGPRPFTTPDDLRAWVATSLAVWFVNRGLKPAEKVAIDDYLTKQLVEWRQLPLWDRGRTDQQKMLKATDLDKVYVQRNVIEPRPTPGELATEEGTKARGDSDRSPSRTVAPERDQSPWSALDACRHHPRLVILGGPGSGKSSFLRALAIDLAKPLVGPGQHDGSRPAPVRFDRALLPVLVVVSEFAALLEPKNKEGKSIRAGDPGVQLAKFIKWSLERQNLGAAYEAIERQLRDGDAILLLDGLDEIAKPDLRAKVLAAIEAFADVHRQTRVMVTCRVAAYTMHEGGGSSTSTRDVPTNAGWSLPFPSVALADLNESQQEEFIKAWHLALEGVPDATERANALRRAVVRPDVQRLARVPLLLTLMAIVNDGVAPLPDQRTALYQMALDELLWKWRHGRRSRMSPADESPVQELLADVGRSTSDLEDRLRRIALAAHESVADKEQKDRTDITVAALSMELGSLCGDPLRRSQWTGNLIDVIRLRSGLIVETKPNVYDFSHQTFREYLAARALASSETNVQQAMELRTASNNHWREPILMMGGTFAHVMKLPELGASMVRALTSAACDERATAPRRIEDLILASDLLGEMTHAVFGKVHKGDALIDELSSALEAAMFRSEHDIKDRARLGAALGRVGDPRAGVARERLSKQGVHYPEIEWSEPIAPGPFPMGNDKPEAKYDTETPRFTCTIMQPYRLSLYPVTVAQYRLFIAAGGYRPGVGDRFWTEQGRAWRNENGITGPGTDDLPEVLETPNHPQVRVSWHEATAFCRWLAEVSGQPIRLPTEMEWERAARHTDARLYPWGNTPSDDEAVECANIAGSIGHTTPVGLYANGAAECKALDMAGNVFEWCQTVWRDNYVKYPQNSRLDDDESPSSRVVRGGAWYVRHAVARCAFRDGVVPGGRNNYVGFRVCVCPFSPSDL